VIWDTNRRRHEIVILTVIRHDLTSIPTKNVPSFECSLGVNTNTTVFSLAQIEVMLPILSSQSPLLKRVLALEICALASVEISIAYALVASRAYCI
jgi:hypothetical protein